MEIFVIEASRILSDKLWFYYSGVNDSFSIDKAKFFTSKEDAQRRLDDLRPFEKRNMSDFKIIKLKG